MSSILVDDVRPQRSARHLHVVPAPVRTPALRLTRRGRLAILLAALLTLAVLVVAFGSSTTATGEAGAPLPVQVVTVQPGDTVWKLATDANPNGDLRQTVDEIMQLNSLHSASGLQMGSEVAVPIYE